jgi:pimeloyl-ACP methyl ester carboxylesterase
MPQTLYEFGGQGAPVHLAVANGFPPPTYRSLAAPLTERYRVFSLPPRALWGNPPPPESVRTWRDLADDLLAGLEAFHIEPVVAIGHSFGAVASLVAAAQKPERFRALVLLDPTIFLPWQMFTLSVLRVFGLQTRMPLVRGALNRRARFANVDEAYAYWRGKRLFHDWPDEAVRLYTAGTTQPDRDGHGIELAWSPAWEARCYQTILTTTWHYLAALRGTLPILLLRGARSDTLSAQVAARMCRVLPQIRSLEVEGYGHLFPHAAPEATLRRIEPWLREQKL